MLLKTKIRGVYKIIEIDDNENNLENFANSIFTAHGIQFDEKVEIEFFENDGAKVEPQHLFPLIRQWIKCASFFIEIVSLGETHKKITSEVSFW